MIKYIHDERINSKKT